MTVPSSKLYESLISDFSKLSKRGDEVNEDDYVVINVSPSVVPTLQPSFRIYSYNVSGTKYIRTREGGNRTRHTPGECKKERYKHSWKCKLDEGWHSDPESPSRSNKLWTPLGYAQVQPPADRATVGRLIDASKFFFYPSCQYYLPALHLANETEPPGFELEYVTYPPCFLDPEGDVGNDGFQHPVPLRSLRLLAIRGSKRPRYDLTDMTISSWIGLAQRLGHGEKGLRKVFKRYLMVKGG
jgi:endopolyphosphatase